MVRGTRNIIGLILLLAIPFQGMAQDTLDVGEVRIIAKDLFKTLYDTVTHHDSTRTVVKNEIPILRNVHYQHRREGGRRVNFIDIKGSSRADSVVVVFENKAVKKKHLIIPDSAFTASFGTHHLFDVSVEVTAYDPQWTITYNETVNLAALDTLGGLQSIRDMALAGSGTEADPYLVGTPSDLDEVRNDKSASYKETADIDMTFDTQDPSGLFYNSGSGWAPIGTFPFWSGTYDGADFTITGLFQNRSNADGIGLFGRFAAGGTVKNLNMESVDITNTGGGAAGIGQARVDSYLIENVSVNGTVTGSDNAGMVMSRIEGASGSTAVVRKCIGSGTVESAATGTSTSGAGSVVGLATSFAVIENSYGFAEVRTHNVGGGVVGYMSGDASVDKSMAYSTFTDLSGSASFLRLVVGRNNFGGPVTNSFGDETVAGFSTTDGGTAKTTTQMQDIATYNDTATTGLSSAWDIVTEASHDGNEATAIWFIDDGNDYPRLWYEYVASGGISGTASITGSSSDVSLAGTLSLTGQLAITGSQQSLSLSGDLSLSGTVSFVDNPSAVSTQAALQLAGTAGIDGVGQQVDLSGALSLSGSITADGSPQTTALAGVLLLDGSAAINGSPQQIAIQGSFSDIIRGTAAIASQSSQAAASGKLVIGGTAALQGEGVSLSIGGALLLAAQAAIEDNPAGFSTMADLLLSMSVSLQDNPSQILIRELVISEKVKIQITGQRVGNTITISGERVNGDIAVSGERISNKTTIN